MKLITKNMATAKEKKLYPVIHILRQQIWGDDREPYEEVLGNFYGVDSSTRLSYKEKLDFIDRLKAIKNGKPQPKPDRRVLGIWASWWQINKIDSLIEVLGWDNPQRLNGFIKRQTGKNKSKMMLTEPEATKVIIGLMKILAGGNRKLYNWLNTATPSLITTPYGRKMIHKLKGQAQQ